MPTAFLALIVVLPSLNVEQEPWTHMIDFLAVSPDGKLAVFGTSCTAKERTFRLWNLETGKEMPTSWKPGSRLTCAAWRPAGAWLVTGADDGSVTLWSAEATLTEPRKEVALLAAHKKGVNCVAYGPEAKVFSGGDDGTVRLSSVAKRETLRVWAGHASRVKTVAISPDGKRALSGSEDKTIKLWDLKEYKEIATWKGHEEGILAIAWAPDGKSALSSADGIKLWEVDTGKVLASTDFWVNGSYCAFLPDGKRFVIQGDDGFNLKNTDDLGSDGTPMKHGYIAKMSLTPDGKRAVSVDHAEGKLKVWDVETAKELASWKLPN